jgi:hypothetical protein
LTTLSLWTFQASQTANAPACSDTHAWSVYFMSLTTPKLKMILLTIMKFFHNNKLPICLSFHSITKLWLFTVDTFALNLFVNPNSQRASHDACGRFSRFTSSVGLFSGQLKNGFLRTRKFFYHNKLPIYLIISL